MLIFKNSILPLLVSLIVILPMKRWYYIAWWLVSVILTCLFSCLIVAVSYYAQQPTSLHWLVPLHYQKILYSFGYEPGVAPDSSQYSIAMTDSVFNYIFILSLGGGAALVFILFWVVVLGGIGYLILMAVLRRRKFNKLIQEKRKLAPKGKTMNVTKLRYRLIYESVKNIQQRELELKLTSYWTRIAPLFLVLIIEVIAVAAVVYLKDYIDETAPKAMINSWPVYAIFGLVIVGICAAVTILLLCNSLVLFLKMRIIIYRINHFITSKALKLSFLVLSSLYIPLAVSIFSLFDCAKVNCDVGTVFTNRKDDISGKGYITQILEQLIQKSSVCTSCQFDIPTSSLAINGSTADAFCTTSYQNTFCPGGSETRLLRQPTISCTSIYPYVATAGALYCLFVVTTPFLILYLINLATRQMGSVEVPHLLQYKARCLRRSHKNKIEKLQSRDLHPTELPALETFFAKQNLEQSKQNFFRKLLTTSQQKAINWEMRLSLVDCSIESLYFPFKYNFRYFKLVFLIAKVILSFINVFGVTLFGQLEENNTIGPQLVLWCTFVIQFCLGLLTIILRPYVIFAETILMIVSAISICANCIFGLVLVYTGIEAPGWIAVSFMAVNSIVLGFASVMSIVFYVYRLKKYDWKGVQRKMKNLLKKRIKSGKKNLSEKQIDKYWRGRGRHNREPYLDLDMLSNPKPQLKIIKSAIKYQKAVAFSLNRTSLDWLINFFFFLSVITTVSGVLLAAHYVILFLNPSYVDHYIQSKLKVFEKPLHVERMGSFSVSSFAQWATLNMDTSNRPLLRNDTEAELEKVFKFGAFPESLCVSAYNVTFAGYRSWNEFIDNCCCTRDLSYEETENESAEYFKNMQVEQWRCNNGIVTRRIRSIDIQMSAVASYNGFRISNLNFISNYTNIHGYDMRGFCEKNFKPAYKFDDDRDIKCSGKKSFHEYAQENSDLSVVSEIWDNYMVIRPEIINPYGHSFIGSTIPYNDTTVENREFYAVIWDSLKSIIARTVLY